MDVCGFRRRPEEEAKLHNGEGRGDAASLDRETDETVDCAVAATERMRVFLRRRQLRVEAM